MKTSKGVALSGDLFIDCSGFSALLIGKHYDIPLTGVDSILFNDRALATQMPYPSPEDSIKSTTWASAQTAGWVWDIGLRDRRGIGYVFSSAHTEEEAAEQVLEDYLRLQTADCKEDASWSAPRLLAFQPGYRETFWHKNCVAIGMAAGFVEPLEASALVLVELGARAIADRFPSHRQAMTVQADRYNREFTARWEHIVEFLKLHYCCQSVKTPTIGAIIADWRLFPQHCKKNSCCGKPRFPGMVKTSALTSYSPQPATSTC